MASKRDKYDAKVEIELLKVEMKDVRRQLAALTDAVRDSHPNPKLPSAPLANSAAESKKSNPPRGPKKRYSAAIFEERDFFVRLLEGQWLKIEPHCGRWADQGLKLTKPPNMISIKKILTSLLDPLNFQIAETAWKLLQKLVFFEKFLTDPKMRKRFSGNPKQARNRFGGDPRQIANALAGVPKVGIWRSLRLCEQKSHRCAVDMADEAIPSYIRRKHPLLARALNPQNGLSHLVSFWLRYKRRMDDPIVKSYTALDLQRIWKQH
jgi:hypothetical protein